MVVTSICDSPNIDSFLAFIMTLLHTLWGQEYVLHLGGVNGGSSIQDWLSISRIDCARGSSIFMMDHGRKSVDTWQNIPRATMHFEQH